MNNKTQKKIRNPQDLYNPINKVYYVTNEKRINDIHKQITESYEKNEITKEQYEQFIKPIIRKQRKLCHTKKNKIYCDKTMICVKDNIINIIMKRVII